MRTQERSPEKTRHAPGHKGAVQNTRPNAPHAFTAAEWFGFFGTKPSDDRSNRARARDRSTHISTPGIVDFRLGGVFVDFQRAPAYCVAGLRSPTMNYFTTAVVNACTRCTRPTTRHREREREGEIRPATERNRVGEKPSSTRCGGIYHPTNQPTFRSLSNRRHRLVNNFFLQTRT